MEVTPARQISHRHALDCPIRDNRKGMRWRPRLLRRLRTQRLVRGMRSRNAKTHIRWRKRTARLRISVGDDYGDGDDGTEKSPGEKSKLAESQVPAGTKRNIGIAAHIDAGKTTITERVLFYHGHDSQNGRGA